MKRHPGLLIGLLFIVGHLQAADPDTNPRGMSPAARAEPSTTKPPVDTRITELQTAGYYELVDRARERGLSTAGGVPELRDRVAKALGLTLPPPDKATERTLTIESAQEAGLIDVDAPGDGKLLRLSGGLHITLVDNEKKVTHIVEAGELWYDQANEEMTARGRVVYTMIRESSREVFRGESLTFRLSDSQGVFYGGASDRSRAVGDQTLVFRYQGNAIRRSNEDLVVLESGTITSSLGTDPYYQIKATKIWVVAPGEWGLQNAVLYLGRIPVLYFPFFYQPGDEFFFNPVLSFPEAGDRRGTSLQTTTYLLGKKKRDTAPLSFLQIEDSSTKDQGRVQKGLYMVRGTPRPSTVPENWTLKWLADFYSNLGFLTAIDLAAPGWAGSRNLTVVAGIGVTRTVDPLGNTFRLNPFQAAIDPWDQSDWNGSWLGSWRLPFRWGGSATLDIGPANFALEYYSDPLLANDLTGSRSENFSVFSLLGMGPAKKTAVAAAKSSLQWNANINQNPVALSASLLWESKAVVPAGPAGDPENSFYLPSQLVAPQATLNLGGTLWPLVSEQRPQTEAGKAIETGLIPPGSETGAASDVSPPVAGLAEPDLTLLPPARLDNASAAQTADEWQTGVTWSLRPTMRTDTRFDTAAVLDPETSPWKVLTSRWSGSYDGKLTWTTGWPNGFWSAGQTFSLHQQTQDSWYLGSSVTDAQKDIFEAQDLGARSGFLSQVLTSQLKPWAGGGPWRESNVQYSLGTKLWEDKNQKSLFFDGTKETVTTHLASSQAIVYLWETLPTVRLLGGWQSTLPPLEPLRTWTGSLDVGVPWAKAATKVSAKQTPQDLTWDPWDSSLEWLPVTGVAAKESFQYDLENGWPLTSTSALSAWGWGVQYRHQRTSPYEFDTATRRWVVSGPQDFLPQELRFSYSLDLPSLQWWYYRNTLSSKVTVAWPINLQQYSQMPLTVNYTVNYRLHRFLDLQVTEGIVNRTMYRYFPAITESFGAGVIEPLNPVADLWDALSFWDQSALHRTGYKMSNLSVALVHYLDDWNVKLDYSGSPQLETKGLVQQFKWVGTLTILVQWYPVPELKTQMQWDKVGTLSVLRNTP